MEKVQLKVNSAQWRTQKTKIRKKMNKIWGKIWENTGKCIIDWRNISILPTQGLQAGYSPDTAQSGIGNGNIMHLKGSSVKILL